MEVMKNNHTQNW